MSQAPAQYLISLCTIAQQSNESFGLAMRIGSSNSIFQFEATKVIHSILTFAPAPDTVAVEFLNELQKIEGITLLVKEVLDRASPFDCPTWSQKIIDYLGDSHSPAQRSKATEPVTQLATEMLSHLLIATRNPGGKKTPQETVHPTPDINRSRKILDLLSEATTKRSQSALKELADDDVRVEVYGLWWTTGFVTRRLYEGGRMSWALSRMEGGVRVEWWLKVLSTE